MTVAYADRVKETATTTGTGPLTLAGALTGFQSFAAGVADGATVTFVTEKGADWEVAEGIFTAPATLSRPTILGSSSAGAAVNWGAGSKTVHLDLVARDVALFSAISGDLSTLVAALAAEVTARANADSTEATAREDADDAEATARGNADAAEAVARLAGDALLIPLTQKGAANGVPDLDATGKVPTSQLPSSVLGDVQYQGSWNATTNSPAIPAAASGNKGQYYVVGTAGATSIDGQTDWKVGDWLVSNGATWDKIDNTDQVTSVAGRQGAIVLAEADITGLPADLAALAATAPSANEKAALAGTGTPSASDKYVNNSDSRMTNARTPTAHTHPESDVTNLVTDLAGKIAATEKGAASGVATLDVGGKVPSAQLPAVALVKPTVVADLAARLALTAESGDVAVQTDTSKTYMLKEAGNPTVDADWIELKAPSGAAPAGAPFVTFATDPTLSAERVVTDTPTVTWDIGTAGQVKASVPDTAITTAKLVANAVTNPKLAQMAAGTLKGNNGGGAADPSDLTASQVKTLLGLVIGTNVQAYSAILDALVAFTGIADGTFVQRSGSAYIGSPATPALFFSGRVI